MNNLYTSTQAGQDKRQGGEFMQKTISDRKIVEMYREGYSMNYIINCVSEQEGLKGKDAAEKVQKVVLDFLRSCKSEV